MNSYDVVILGAGFAGLSAAEQFKNTDFKVLLLDKKKNLKNNIHTTGIIVQEAIDEWEISPENLKPISKVNLISPHFLQASLNSEKYNFYMTNTGGTLNEKLSLIDSLPQVTISLGQKISEIKYEQNSILLPQINVKTKYLILAAGAKSKLTQDLGFPLNHKYLAGHELEFPLNTLNLKDEVNVFIHPKICKGYIGWLTPGVESIQVGLAVNQGEKLSIDDFLNHIHKMFPLKKEQASGQRSGLIPIGGTSSEVFKNNVLIVGDAAGYVSPLTAGGIHTAMRYGRNGGKLIKELLLQDQKDHPQTIKSYQRKLPKFRKKHLLKKTFDLINTNIFWYLLFKLKIIHLLGVIVFYTKKRLK